MMAHKTLAEVGYGERGARGHKLWRSPQEPPAQTLPVHERTFLQETPQGDVVIVTLDGGDPMAAFGKMMADPTARSVIPAGGWGNEQGGIAGISRGKLKSYSFLAQSRQQG